MLNNFLNLEKLELKYVDLDMFVDYYLEDKMLDSLKYINVNEIQMSLNKFVTKFPNLEEIICCNLYPIKGLFSNIVKLDLNEDNVKNKWSFWVEVDKSLSLA